METQISFAVLTAIVTGLVQMAKGLKLPTKFLPLLAVILGPGLSLLAMVELHTSLVSSILTGLVIGLTSVGLYSGTKNTVEGFRAPKG